MKEEQLLRIARQVTHEKDDEIKRLRAQVASLSLALRGNRGRRSESFPVWMRTERALKGWTQRQLAKAAGCGPSWVNRIESGQFDASPETIAKIERALGTQYRSAA